METQNTQGQCLEGKPNLSEDQKKSKTTVLEESNQETMTDVKKAEELWEQSWDIFLKHDNEGAITVSYKATELDPKNVNYYYDRICFKRDCDHPTTSESVRGYLIMIKKYRPEEYDEVYRSLDEDGILADYGNLIL